MKHSRLLPALLVALPLFLTACATGTRVPEAPLRAPAPPPQRIGRVIAINDTHKFVLVDAFSPTPSGTALQARDGRGHVTARLRAAEQYRTSISADIMSGYPRMGDTVTK